MGFILLKYTNKIEGEIPIEALASKAPIYDRKWSKKKPTNEKVDLKNLKKIKIEDALIKILSSPNHSNKSWITNQYDQSVMCDTIQKSGSDAAIIRIHNKDKAIAVSVDSFGKLLQITSNNWGKTNCL